MGKIESTDNVTVEGSAYSDLNHTSMTSRCARIARQRLRIMQWLPKYDRLCFVSDLIAGITVGLTMMPQSIAYASIMDLPPHVGLYTAIMGSFVYIFFGSIKQVSIGPSSLMSMLTFTYVGTKGVDYAVLLAFLAGIVEFLMGLLNLGFLVDFISLPVTSGFTSATSMIIVLGQLKNIFGIKYRTGGNLLVQFWRHIPEYRLADTAMGIGCVIFLLTVRYVSKRNFKNEKVAKAMWFFSICKNAIAIIICSAISFNFEHNTGTQPFKIVGKITPGLPSFKLPNFSTDGPNGTVGFIEMVEDLGTGIIVIPVVAVLANVAIAKSFSAGASIDATQEMMTLGVANVMGSFVGAVPTTGAFTRSAVNDASNVQTPMSGLYAGSLILMALSFLTPYFYFIPKCSIAAVLICAVMFMIEVFQLAKLWKCNVYDFAIWIITFCTCVMIGVEQGLVVGVCLNMTLLIKAWTRPKIFYEIRSNGKDNDFLLIKPELGLYFPGVNHLSDYVGNLARKHPHLTVVLDMINIVHIDYTGCRAIVEINKQLKNREQNLVFLNVSGRIFRQLKTHDNLDNLPIHNTIQEGYDELFEITSGKETQIPLLEQEKTVNGCAITV